MTLADVLAVLSGLAVAGGGFACFSLILEMVAPRAVERAGARAAGRPGRSAAAGALVLLAALVVAGSLLKAASPLARLVAITTVLGSLSLAVLGGAALAGRLGRRYRGLAAGPVTLPDLTRGVLLLEGAVLLPIVGWFVVLPAAFLISLGAGFHAVFWPGAPKAAAAEPVAQG